MSESPQTNRDAINLAFFLALLLAIVAGTVYFYNANKSLAERLVVAEQRAELANQSIEALTSEQLRIAGILTQVQAALSSTDTAEKITLLENIITQVDLLSLERDNYLLALINNLIQQLNVVLGTHNARLTALEAKVQELANRPARVVTRPCPPSRGPVVVCDEAMSCVRVR